jgi:restriction endonuclease
MTGMCWSLQFIGAVADWRIYGNMNGKHWKTLFLALFFGFENVLKVLGF